MALENCWVTHKSILTFAIFVMTFKYWTWNSRLLPMLYLWDLLYYPLSKDVYQWQKGQHIYFTRTISQLRHTIIIYLITFHYLMFIDFLFLILMLFNSTSRVYVSFRLNPFHLSLQLSFSEIELLCHQLWLLSPGEESSISPYLWPSQFQQLQGRGW